MSSDAAGLAALPDGLPIRLRRSVGKGLLLLAVCLVFDAIAVMMVRDGEHAGYAIGAVFALGTLVAAVSLHPDASHLEIGAEGFAVTSLFRRSFVPWGHVREFVPIRLHHNAMVGWNCTPEFARRSAARQASLALAGVEAAMPDTYGMSAEGLAGLLNALLARARAGP